MPFTLAAPVHSEFVIKKSRFLGCVEPVAGREAAVARVQELWAEHPDARHICWALMAGGHSAANDDGEPSGTAGRPMLEVLRHQELEGVLATVVRYFGGVKLGAGGLVRAYTDAVAQALLGAERVPLIRTRMLRVSVPYAQEGAVRRELEVAGAELGEASHGVEVELSFAVPEDRAGDLAARVDDICQGRAVWH
ncbi:IMPACT family protein [Microbacterium sp. zg.Y1090]|uniref:IMPACT family protein n=1 Tax=Microbacterium TaxID=33882 RepID=UPI00214B0F88|nr:MULTISPECIES: YigZ family protein [unclassified Microbacterium]MCR2812132.1 IMPACT family protein [Microbacterium sp. zg.Y1084]MCR2818430.1 IMPACT family protein [Microbacterium sp. zg.Y1090]MDL5486243.1 YigZ family protein [Microbacterium sp. zg-Y1211]WIM29441.1 YigZ family protein [Microbacterium sp. zg-Y1090]